MLAYVINSLIPTDVPKTCGQIAKDTGYSPNMLKKYLGRLVDIGMVKRHVHDVGAGRSYIHYAAKEELLRVGLDELLAKMRGVSGDNQ